MGRAYPGNPRMGISGGSGDIMMGMGRRMGTVIAPSWYG